MPRAHITRAPAASLSVQNTNDVLENVNSGSPQLLVLISVASCFVCRVWPACPVVSSVSCFATITRLCLRARVDCMGLFSLVGFVQVYHGGLPCPKLAVVQLARRCPDLSFSTAHASCGRVVLGHAGPGLRSVRRITASFSVVLFSPQFLSFG